MARVGLIFWLIVAIVVGVLALLAVEYFFRRFRRAEQDRQAQEWAATEDSIRRVLVANNRQDVIDDVRLRAVANQAHLDQICAVTATALGAPAAVITVVEIDGQRWLAHYGAEWCSDETRAGLIQPLETSYCKFVVATDQPLIITDSFKDVRVRNTSADTLEAVRAYIGAPVHAADGTPVGSLCVFDFKPRQWSHRDRTVLTSFAALVAL